MPRTLKDDALIVKLVAATLEGTEDRQRAAEVLIRALQAPPTDRPAILSARAEIRPALEELIAEHDLKARVPFRSTRSH